MRARIIRIGNSRGIRIPKALLEEAGFDADVELEAKRGQITIRAAQRHPRAGWEEQARRMHQAGDDFIPGWTDAPSPTRFDDEEWEWD